MTLPLTLRNSLGTLFLAGTLLLGGCSGPLAVPSTSTALPSGRATLVLNPDFQPAHLRTQAVVPRLTSEDVDHVRVQLMRVVPDGEVAVRNNEGPLAIWIERSQLDRPIVIGELHPHTHYRIRAWAYRAPDEVNENLISLDNAAEVIVGDDDRPTVAPLRVQLLDVPFNGKASIPFLDFQPGGYVPDGVEGISFAQPDPIHTPMTKTWLGFDADMVGPESAASDGVPDAHLRCTVELPQGSAVQAVALQSYDSEDYTIPGVAWTSMTTGYPGERLLGVFREGQRLNAGFVETLGSFSGPTTFDFYAHGAESFAPGKTFMVVVLLADGTILWDDFAVPAAGEG